MADKPLKTVTSSTTVKQIDDAITIWQRIGNNSNSSKAHIAHLQESRLKLIGLLQRDYTASLNLKQNYHFSKLANMGEAQKRHYNLYKQGLVGLMKNNYEKLSLEQLNDLKKHLNSAGRKKVGNEHDEKEISSKNGAANNVLDFFEGKKDINMMTVIKTTASVAAISLLAQAGATEAIAGAAAWLWAANPVIAVCIGVSGLAGLGALIYKVFGSELKALSGSIRAKKAFGVEEAKVTAEQFDTDKAIKEQEQIDKETSEREAKEKAEQEEENKQKTDLFAEIGGFKPNSIEEVEAFIAKYDKIPTEVNNAIKSAGIDFGQMFKAEAFNLVRAGKQNEVGGLRAKFGNYLSAADMDNLQKSVGIEEQGKEDFSYEFEQVEKNEATTKATKAKQGFKSNQDSFNNFKANYNAIVTDIVHKTNPSKTFKDIRALEDFIKDTSNFNVSGKPNGTPESENLKTLCSKMVQMLKELQEQVIAKGATFADEKDAKDKIAQAHNLKADDLENLLN